MKGLKEQQKIDVSNSYLWRKNDTYVKNKQTNKHNIHLSFSIYLVQHFGMHCLNMDLDFGKEIQMNFPNY